MSYNMSFSYREELLENTDNVTQLGNGDYQVKCPWCGEQFTSHRFLKAVNREGVHRAEKHIQSEGKIPKPENGRDTKTSILDTWQQQINETGEVSQGSEKLVLQIAEINRMKSEKIV